MMLRGDGGTGYIRVDWFTPDGLPTWGDGRLTILGTDGFIEIRKNVDIAGRPGGSHLFLSTRRRPATSTASEVALPYGAQLVDDILEPHRDGDAAGALLPGDRAGAQGAAAGAARRRCRRSGPTTWSDRCATTRTGTDPARSS